MPRNNFICVNHFRNVVTTSAGNPTCRECGLAPTVAEAESLQGLLEWDKARTRASLAANRTFATRRDR